MQTSELRRIAQRNVLMAQNWDMIYQGIDIDSAYKTFLNICHYLIKTIQSKNTVENYKLPNVPPNACKNKNTLYIDFIRLNYRCRE